MLGGLKPDDWGKAYDIRDSLYQVKSLRDMLETGGKAEEVIEWTDPITGAPCKAKPDWVSNDGKLMIDLKSSRDASPLGFAKAVRNYDYDLSAAMYLIGAEEALGVRPRWLWVVVENTAPYAPAIYEMSPATRATGEEKMYQALEVYEKCRRSGVWPGYENGVI